MRPVLTPGVHFKKVVNLLEARVLAVGERVAENLECTLPPAPLPRAFRAWGRGRG
jgi:hypothetical protein